jgi:hypothetical protein
VELVVALRRPQRPDPPDRELAHGRLQSGAIRGQLVDLGRSRRRQPALRHDAASLEVLEARREDVRADSWQAACKVGVALRTLQQLTDDEKSPPLANEVERVGDRTVLLVALAHVRILASQLAVVKE